MPTLPHTVAVLPALGPVPPSIFADTEPPCDCEDCKDLAFASWVRDLEAGEHDHLEIVA